MNLENDDDTQPVVDRRRGRRARDRSATGSTVLGQAGTPANAEFEQNVLPVLSRNCVRCHSDRQRAYMAVAIDKWGDSTGRVEGLSDL